MEALYVTKNKFFLNEYFMSMDRKFTHLYILPLHCMVMLIIYTGYLLAYFPE